MPPISQLIERDKTVVRSPSPTKITLYLKFMSINNSSMLTDWLINSTHISSHSKLKSIMDTSIRSLFLIVEICHIDMSYLQSLGISCEGFNFNISAFTEPNLRSIKSSFLKIYDFK